MFALAGCNPDVVCGDGTVAAPETCDDGNTAAEDGCSAACVTEPGWSCPASGGACSNIDDCASNPCLNGGVCTDGVDAFTCACAAGFFGATCETNVQACAPNPCLNGGTCTDGVNGFTCACPAGFSGATCEANVDDCAPNPCLNGGTCTDGVDAFTCACATGYSGATCATNIDDCAPNPCLNGGTCTDGVADFTCSCAPGYSGADCAVNIDECAPNPCLNNGTCTDGVNAFTCACAAGYSGATCATNIDECVPNPCLNGGTCTDGVASFTCQCAANFTGTTCNGCPGTLANCNGVASDGCEANLQSSAQHCNACNAACPSMQICSNGACRVPPVSQEPGVPVNSAAAHNPMAPAVADLNRDGKLDILVANAESGSAATPSGSLSVFFGNADSTVQPEVNYTGAPLSSSAVVAVDVDEDGWLDAVTVDGQPNLATTNGSISVYRNLGAAAPGTFGQLLNFTTGAPGSVHLCTADFNRDGHADIATTSVVSNQVSVLLGAGTGSFGVPTLISIPATGGVQSTIACRDLNGDLYPDLVVTSPSSARLLILVNEGTGSFAAPVAYTNSQNGQTAGIAFGDVDGDGKVDILSNGAAGAYLYFFKSNGDGTVSNGVASSTGASAVSNSALGVVTGDFNGDNKLDAYILVTAANGGVRPMTGNGAGTFVSSSVVSTGASPGLNAITTADMNADGYLDLILTNRGSSTVTVIPNGL
ncbi:MAG: hypothetical protein DI536_22765 [Archangium gephyra]|uniref:EGF-like domain-containing protein n=1 Tax=Archangium gephyra TaxID=48 RepID=A0A2W5T2T2_9BACT|nr:MAG: hypothetical protein DI536_22765 [Archangium gephyra]